LTPTLDHTRDESYGDDIQRVRVSLVRNGKASYSRSAPVFLARPQLDNNGNTGLSSNIVATAGWRQSGPGPMIYVFAPNGRVLETHPLPEDRPSNCAFGDDDMASLYVTTITGWLLRARTHRRGVFLGRMR
jgi:hypothetical protein